MKKIFYILSFLLAANIIVAQVNTNLVVSATPPSSLLQWSTNREILTFIVAPSQGIQGQYKIKTEIKLTDGTVVGKTDLARAATYTLSSTTTIYNASDVVPMQNMVFNGKYKTSLEKTGKLPAENYQICVQLVRPPDFVPFSEERCRNFNLAATQLPILLKPYNEEVLNYDLAKTAIIFRWSPVVPTPKFIPSYIIRVFEVLPHQNPVQAMRSNFPILTQEVRGTTQYIWQPQGIIADNTEDETQQRKGWNGKVTEDAINPTDSAASQIRKGWNGTVKGRKYLWTVQSLDNLGNPMGDGNINGDGVSEPTLFYVNRRNVPNEKITFPPNSVAYKITFPPNAFFISEKITFPPNSVAKADKITFPPNSVFQIEKITFPPNSIADKITFPPNSIVEKITFPPNAIFQVEKITFPPNSVFEAEKITFPPNSFAKAHKITFPPNSIVEKITFPPNSIVSAEKITFPPNSIVEKITFPPNSKVQLSDKITFPPNSVVYKITFPPNVYISADKITFPPNVSQ